ncbi:tetratricopeptide repeat protein, partial [Planomonospora algeriensis]
HRTEAPTGPRGARQGRAARSRAARSRPGGVRDQRGRRGGRLDAARAELTEAIRLAREEVPPPWHPLIALAGPIVALFLGARPDDGHLDEMSVHPDPWVRALIHLFLGAEQLAAGRIGACEAEMTACLDGFRRLGERWGIGNALAVLGELDFLRGEPERGLEKLREAIAVLEEITAVDELAYMRGRLAFALNLTGDRATAGELLEESLRFALRSGDRVGGMSLLAARGDFAREAGDFAEARRCYAEALRVVDSEPSMPAQVRAVIGISLGLLAEQEGDLVRARRLLGAALEQAAGSTDAGALGMALIGLAGLVLSEGDPAGAAALLGGAATVRGVEAVVDFDHVRITGRARAALGEEGFSLHYERGRALSREDVVSLAGRLPPHSQAASR